MVSSIRPSIILGTPQLPDPRCDQAAVRGAQDALGGLQHFDCVTEAIAEARGDGGGAKVDASSPKDLTVFQQHQFERFLDQAEEERKDQPGLHWRNHLTKSQPRLGRGGSLVDIDETMSIID
jgi:hypothetical protein